MKALFGVVSLLVALAIVGLVAVKQLRSVGRVGGSAAATDAGVAPLPQMSGSGTVRQQARDFETKVGHDVARAMAQGAEARKDQVDKQDADKP